MLKLNPLKKPLWETLDSDRRFDRARTTSAESWKCWMGGCERSAFPCQLSADFLSCIWELTRDAGELIAASFCGEIREMIGADSLMYLTLDDLVDIVDGDEKFCMVFQRRLSDGKIIDSEC